HRRGDDESMKAIRDLHRRWVEKFGVGRDLPISSHLFHPLPVSHCLPRRIPRLPTPKQAVGVLKNFGTNPNPPPRVSPMEPDGQEHDQESERKMHL
ncbi:UNVERIFIED_CONTAM: hypothetical protein Sindi_1993800, partial [Sesamum indicum]